MLSTFTMRYIFCKLTVHVHVDCDRRETFVSVTYDRILLRHNVKQSFDSVRTPELCDAWARRAQGVHGNTIESLEYQCRTGILTKDAA